mmetsp:Transcript_875/g.2648  ORF Transcript_875/g.2648 Transcript_875/m.2648 type:complete len:204 (-) Transcript_875:330-941(-)
MSTIATVSDMRAIGSPAATVSGRSSVLAPSSSCRYLGGATSSRCQLLATPRRHRRPNTQDCAAQCFGAAAAAWSSDSSSSFDTLSHLASLAGFALGALWVGRELVMEQQDTEQGREVCETCQGTGRVPCICTRWSDNDVGCGSCNNTGLAVCQDCSGGGTRVPVGRAVPVYVEKNKDSYRGGPYGCSHSHGEKDHHHCQHCHQ